MTSLSGFYPDPDPTGPPDVAEIDDVLALVRAELLSATRRFPPFASAHEGYAVILEELDELWDEVKNSKDGDAATWRQRREALQVAAMGARFLLDVHTSTCARVHTGETCTPGGAA